MMRPNRRPQGPRLPARLQPGQSRPAPPPRKDSTFLIGAAILGAGLVLALATYRFLEAGRRARAEAWANQAVAEKLAAAHVRLARREWGPAIGLLQEALATDNASNRGAAQALLTQAQEDWAGEVLQAARAAARARKRPAARALLKRYLADPRASAKDQALRLRDEIEQAEQREAAERLAWVQQQEAEQRRQARLQATPAYAELVAFVLAIRAQHREWLARQQDDERRLALLFRVLHVNTPEEQVALREQLCNRQAGRDRLVASVARERAALKEQGRAYHNLADADRQAFERMVDAVLDGLLTEVQEPRQKA